MITAEHLIAIGVLPAKAYSFAASLAAACAKLNIPSGKPEAAFVAQLAVESMMFTRLEENLYYTTPQRVVAVFGSRCSPEMPRLLKNPAALADFVYANRLGNGNEASGDGWKYRGRGLIQLTGFDNYYRYGYHRCPDLLATDLSIACEVAGRYWNDRHCTDLAIAEDYDGITRAINGKTMLDKDKRKALTLQYLALDNSTKEET